MKFIYITTYEAVFAYSTPRKAIESLLGQDWEISTFLNDHPDYLVVWPLLHSSVSRAITQLNKKGYLCLNSGREGMIVYKKQIL